MAASTTSINVDALKAVAASTASIHIQQEGVDGGIGGVLHDSNGTDKGVKGSEAAPGAVQEYYVRGQYSAVITALDMEEVRSPAEDAYLGISLLRTGQLEQARKPLEAAALAGESEAQVEWGNWLRARGHTAEAQRYLATILPNLSGELRLRTLRWLGLCEDLLGLPTGVDKVEQARTGYMLLGNSEMAARISHTLASMYAVKGHTRNAIRMLDEALPTLEKQVNKLPYLSALTSLSDLQLELGLYGEAQQTLSYIKRLSAIEDNLYISIIASVQLCQLHLLQGEQGLFRKEIRLSIELSEQAGDLAMLEVSLSFLADYHSRMGEHQQALQVMLKMHALRPESSLTSQITEALLTRRRGDLHGAYRKFAAIQEAAAAQSDMLLAARAGLQLVYTVYLMRDYEKVRALLPDALNAILRFGTPGGPLDLRPDFDELAELFAFAELEPHSAPVLASLLGQGAEYAGGSADLLAPTAHLELLVLGQQVALKDGVPLTFALKNTVSVMLYLALYPGRTRREIQLDLFPDKDAEAAGNYVRKCIAEVGKVAGPVVVQDGPHNAPTYRYSPKVSVSSDFQLLRSRLAQDNLPGAVALYRGELLPGLDESQWVNDLREETLASVQATLKGLIQEALERGDHARVVLLCTQGLKFDPDDFELAETRLESARFASTPQEQARFRSEFKRRLN